ncbi:MAG: hypothetical protein BJ554DRAFT_8053 [Olpidium bornovanus]|uniref:Uncharacterized protein n=1 Tax=Olpidium bornovanus TaxID=278681 RepID=A0A8H8DIW5_9FUNG|nr:MAG: hypothetical protein BJ554DRAFT_8053 [Olpidium bornovanus]
MSGAGGDPRGIRSSNAGGPAYDHSVSSHTQGQSQSRQDYRYSHATSSSTSGSASGLGSAAGPAGISVGSGPNGHDDGVRLSFSLTEPSLPVLVTGNSRSREFNDSLPKARCPKSPRGQFSPSPSLSRAAAAAAADAKNAGSAEDAVGTGGSAAVREAGVDGGSGNSRRDASPSVNSVASLNAGKEKPADKSKKKSFDPNAAEAYLQQGVFAASSAAARPRAFSQDMITWKMPWLMPISPPSHPTIPHLSTAWNKIYPQLDDPDVPDHREYLRSSYLLARR